MDFRLICSGVFIENHTQSFCKLLYGNPELTVKCLTGKRFGKPRRSMNWLTLPGNQLMACPEFADTVKFFTNPTAPNVISLLPGFCKHQRMCLYTWLESKVLLLIGVKKPLFQNVFNQWSTIFSGKYHPAFLLHTESTFQSVADSVYCRDFLSNYHGGFALLGFGILMLQEQSRWAGLKSVSYTHPEPTRPY